MKKILSLVNIEYRGFPVRRAVGFYQKLSKLTGYRYGSIWEIVYE